MNRLSSRKNAGSRKNKRHKFVNSFESDSWRCLRNRTPCTLRISETKPQHELRYTDIRDCFPLTKLGHN